MQVSWKATFENRPELPPIDRDAPAPHVGEFCARCNWTVRTADNRCPCCGGHLLTPSRGELESRRNATSRGSR